MLARRSLIQSTSGGMSGASVADPTAGDANWYYTGTRGAASQENKISAGSPPSPAMIGPTSTFYNPDDVSFQQREEQLRQWSESFSSTAHPQATPQITYNPAFGQDQALQGMFNFVNPHFHNTNMSSFGGFMLCILSEWLLHLPFSRQHGAIQSLL